MKKWILAILSLSATYTNSATYILHHTKTFDSVTSHHLSKLNVETSSLELTSAIGVSTEEVSFLTLSKSTNKLVSYLPPNGDDTAQLVVFNKSDLKEQFRINVPPVIAVESIACK